MLLWTFYDQEFANILGDLKTFLIMAGLLGGAHGFAGFFRGI